MPQKFAITSTKAAPHSRRSPPAAWKETLRRACLDRARQRWMNYQDHQQERTCTANQIIAWEMHQNGVSVKRDNVPENDWQQQSHESNNGCQHMTEEEWIDLLEQVERELERIRNEREIDEQDTYLEHQMANYEEWQREQSDHDDPGTICPVCWDGRLTVTAANDIVCPNRMDGSCTMRLSNVQGSLQQLRETLCLPIQQHSAACPGTLSFQMDPYGTYLVASCSVCGGSQHLKT